MRNLRRVRHLYVWNKGIADRPSWIGTALGFAVAYIAARTPVPAEIASLAPG